MANLKQAKKWLERASSDYADATVLDKHTWPKSVETICYLCQQATEKSLKSILVYNEEEVPKTHNIRELMNRCAKYDSSIKMDGRIVNKMTDFATASRYPDNMNEWTEEDTKLGLKHSKQILDMVALYLENANEEQNDNLG